MADDVNLQWALSTYQGTAYRKNLALALRYYDGDHRMKLATEKFRSTFGDIFREFADNLCPAVVDSLAERLSITGWRSNQATVTVTDVPGTDLPGIPARKKVTVDDPLGDSAQTLWDENEMASRASEVHTEAIKTGNAYVLVWPNEQLVPEFYPQTDAEFSVEYDENRFGVLKRACKIWYLAGEKKWRLNVYLPDRIDKYISAQEMPNGISDSLNAWVPFQDPKTGPSLTNPYGVVPAFHFANKRVYKPGVSELKDVIPIQDALNKSIVDMLVAMEFASFRQRYVIGMEVETDEVTGEPTDANVRQMGVDRMMAIPGAKDEIEVGEFQSTDLSQFRQVSNDFRAECARVSGTPLHYFFITSGDFPSGEAIKSAEARFVAKILKGQENWGPQWGKAMAFAQSISDVVPDGYLINPIWKDAQPRSESENADVAVKKKAIGVSRSQLLKEAGYDDDTIERMLEETDAYEATKASLAAQGHGPDVQPDNTNGSGGGTATAVTRAAQARREGRVPGVQS